MPEVRTYSPKDTLLVIGGLPVSGFAEGTFIVLRRNSPRFSLKVGADGEVGRTKSADATATCEVTLKQTSPTNARFSVLAQADNVSGAGVSPFLLREGDTIVAGGQCWVAEEPEAEYADEEGTRRWVFHVANVDPFLIAGNPITGA